MDMRQIEVTCPCCNTKLVVDTRTERVLKSMAPSVTDESGKPKLGEKDWSQALSKVKDREASGTGKMDSFLAAERDKASRLEDKFREAQKKLEKSGGAEDQEA